MQDAVQYAYFAPYTYERHQEFIAQCQADDREPLLACRPAC